MTNSRAVPEGYTAAEILDGYAKVSACSELPIDAIAGALDQAEAVAGLLIDHLSECGDRMGLNAAWAVQELVLAARALVMLDTRRVTP